MKDDVSANEEELKNGDNLVRTEEAVKIIEDELA